MECKFKTHNNMAVVGFCISPDCDQISLCCNQCLEEFHREHNEDFINLDASEKLIETLKENQRVLLESLKNKIYKATLRPHIEKIESNMEKIEQIDQIIKKQSYEELEKQLPFIKHLYALYLEMNKGFLQKEFEKFEKDLDNNLNQLLYPASFHLLKGIINKDEIGEKLSMNKEWQAAIHEFNKALHFEENNIKLYVEKSKSLRNLRQYKEAQKCLDKAFDIDQKNPSIFEEQGNLLKEQKQYVEAINQYDESLRNDSENLLILNAKGQCLLGLKYYENALVFFETISVKQPYCTMISIGKVKALLGLNKVNEAIITLNQLMDLDSNCVEAYYLKGIALTQLQFNEEGKKYIEQAKLKGFIPNEEEVFGFDLNDYLEQAHSLIQQEKYEEAEIIYQKVLEKNSQFLDLYLDQCQSLLGSNKAEVMIKWLDLAIKIDSENPRIYDLQMQTFKQRINQLIKKQKYVEAYSLLKKGLKLDQDRIEKFIQTENWENVIGITFKQLQGAGLSLSENDQKFLRCKEVVQ